MCVKSTETKALQRWSSVWLFNYFPVNNLNLSELPCEQLCNVINSKPKGINSRKERENFSKALMLNWGYNHSRLTLCEFIKRIIRVDRSTKEERLEN